MHTLPRLAIIAFAICALAPCVSEAWTITSRGALGIDTTATPGVQEFSGIAYRNSPGGSTHEFVAVVDSGNKLVTLSVGLATNGSLVSAASTASTTLSPGYDFEGVALGPSGSVLVAEETTPAIRRYNATSGASMASLAMPPVFSSERSNLAFESLTRLPFGETYWTANEQALSPDGPVSNTSQGTTVRLQQFQYTAAGALSLGPQYAYKVDPIHVGTTTNSNTRSGLSDLVALPDGSLLALERSLGVGLPPYQSRIYRVTFDGATNTSLAPYNAGLDGQTFTAASKTLLWSGQAGGGFGQNLEGLALGPMLPNGDFSLIGVIDNSGGSDTLSGNNVVAFSLRPTLPGDFNFDGSVDAADYVVWVMGYNGANLAAHYDVWRGRFGTTLPGAGGNSPSVPEPTTIVFFVAALTAAISKRFFRG